MSQSKKAIMYVRVSTDEQVDNYSLGTQEELCEKEALSRGYDIVDVFREEGKSAKTISGRPTLIKMLSYCLKNRKKIDALFVYRLDRVAREVGDYIAIRKKLYEYQIKLISTREPTGETPSETFMEQVFAATAQYDNAIRGERSINGMYARFKAGLPNAVPLGYLLKDGFVVKDGPVYDTVKMAWDLMATGTKIGYEVASIINSKGLKIRGRRPKSKDFYRLFRNKFYCGILTSKTYKEEVVGQHDPMISHEQFNRVQQIIDHRYSRIPKVIRYGRNHPDFPYKKHIRCSKCLHFMTGAWSGGRCKKYPYYTCGIRCVTVSINANKLHEMLNILVQNTPVGEKYKIILINLFHTRSEQQRRSSNQRHKKINEEITELKDKRIIVVRKNVSGIFSDEITKEQIESIKKQIADLETESKKIRLYSSNMQQLRDLFRGLIEDFYSTYQKATVPQRQILLHFLFPGGLIWDYDGFFKINTVQLKKEVVEQRVKEAFGVLLEVIENY